MHLHAYYKFLLLAASVEACRRNIKFNGSVAASKVESHLDDARVYMLTHPKEFDVVSGCYSYELAFTFKYKENAFFMIFTSAVFSG